MACWSAENATNAFLRAMNMCERNKEPDTTEFTSALAAGNNSQLMILASSTIAHVSTTLLALVAAATQTGGRAVCILPSLSLLHPSKLALGHVDNADCVEFIVGDVTEILLNECKGADFVVIDCNIEDYEGVFRAAQESINNNNNKGGVIVGYNALHKGNWGTKFNTHFLPIGDQGLLVTRIVAGNINIGRSKRSRWIVKVDKCTGEEHVFRVILSKQIEA